VTNLPYTRRRFVHSTAISMAGAALACASKSQAQPVKNNLDLQGEIGITTGSFMKHLSIEPMAGKLCLLDLPKIMRDEWGMRVMDVMTATLASMEQPYLDDLRNRADKHGVVITNLKMNQLDIDMGSDDRAERERALQVYRQTIDVAHRLGCRWVRPLPKLKRTDLQNDVDSYRRLIEYAAPRGISILVENFGWMQSEPQAIPKLIEAIGNGVDACPDTGNWTDEAREAGLKNAFPLAVTCDFKAMAFDEQGNHPQYDLRKCFQLGWEAGFRGPWCIEHFSPSWEQMRTEIVVLRDRLKLWASEFKKS
jgi:hypothetical protein